MAYIDNLLDWGDMLFGQYTHESINEARRSEEHTSELQSLTKLVCRLLLEKKKELMLY